MSVQLSEHRRKAVGDLANFLQDTSKPFARVYGCYRIGKTEVIEQAIKECTAPSSGAAKPTIKEVRLIDKYSRLAVDHLIVALKNECMASKKVMPLPLLKLLAPARRNNIPFKWSLSQIQLFNYWTNFVLDDLSDHHEVILLWYCACGIDSTHTHLQGIFARGSGMRLRKLILEQRQPLDIPWLKPPLRESIKVGAFDEQEAGKLIDTLLKDTFVAGLAGVAEKEETLKKMLALAGEALHELCGRHPGLIDFVCKTVREAATDPQIFKEAFDREGGPARCFERLLENYNMECRGEVIRLLRSLPPAARRAIREQGYHEDFKLNGLLIEKGPEQGLPVKLLRKYYPKISGDKTKTQGKNMPTEKIKIFYSYSHQDEKHRKQLERHLALLRRNGAIIEWHDRKIAPGEEWKGKIDDHLNSAHIILLLVSAHFIDSNYCYDMEMTRAMERQAAGEARVIPIILSPCLWEAAPFGKLQALPVEGKPVTEWQNREKVFRNIAEGVQAVVAQLGG